MNVKSLRALSAHQRAMVAISVLLDGHEASLYLENDALVGEALAVAVKDLVSLSPEFRNILAGNTLRRSLEELEQRFSPGVSREEP
ncbi:MAG: hypothetical protein ACO3XO_00190 [Bdellovibrionota bacterium]